LVNRHERTDDSEWYNQHSIPTEYTFGGMASPTHTY